MATGRSSVDVTLCGKNNSNHETTIKSEEDDKNPLRFESLQDGAAIKISALENDTRINRIQQLQPSQRGVPCHCQTQKGDQTGNTT